MRSHATWWLVARGSTTGPGNSLQPLWHRGIQAPHKGRGNAGPRRPDGIPQSILCGVCLSDELTGQVGPRILNDVEIGATWRPIGQQTHAVPAQPGPRGTGHMGGGIVLLENGAPYEAQRRGQDVSLITNTVQSAEHIPRNPFPQELKVLWWVGETSSGAES